MSEDRIVIDLAAEILQIARLDVEASLVELSDVLGVSAGFSSTTRDHVKKLALTVLAAAGDPSKVTPSELEQLRELPKLPVSQALQRLAQELAKPNGCPVTSGPGPIQARVAECAGAIWAQVTGREAGCALTGSWLVPAGSVTWGNKRTHNALWSVSDMLATVAFPDVRCKNVGPGPARVG